MVQFRLPPPPDYPCQGLVRILAAALILLGLALSGKSLWAKGSEAGFGHGFEEGRAAGRREVRDNYTRGLADGLTMRQGGFLPRMLDADAE